MFISILIIMVCYMLIFDKIYVNITILIVYDIKLGRDNQFFLILFFCYVGFPQFIKHINCS